MHLSAAISHSGPQPRKTGRILFILLLVIVLSVAMAAITKLLMDRNGLYLRVQNLQTTTPPCGTWTSIDGPGLGGYASSLAALAVISPNDIWGVGKRRASTAPLPFGDKSPTVEFGTDEPLVVRWNGIGWKTYTIPSLAANKNYSLSSVTAVSPDDVWAVGSTKSADKSDGTTVVAEQTFIAHWDGSSWRVVDSPNPGTFDNFLTDIVATSSNDAWAVGYYEDANLKNWPMVLRWNGTDWQIDQTLPFTDREGMLFSVTAASPDQIWAVGKIRNDSPASPAYEPLALRLTGLTWSIVPVPKGKQENYLSAVSASTAENVWAIGVGDDNSATTMHWDGTRWQVVTNPLNRYTSLNDLVAVSDSDVWVAGSSQTGQTVVLHWNGNSWSNVAHPMQTSVQSFTGIGYSNDATPTIWFVGGTLQYSDGPYYALISQFTISPCAAPSRQLKSAP